MPRRRSFVATLLAALGDRRLRLGDVGARGGLPPRWREVARALDVVAFEPDPTEAERLRAAFAADGVSCIEVAPAALWSSAGEQRLHLTRSPGCSSLLEPNVAFLAGFPDAPRFDVLRELAVTTTTLDAALADSRVPGLDFVKIDVQGAALQVLEGAAGALEAVSGIEVEVELASMYREEPLFGDVDAALRRAGFELVDLRPTYWRRDEARGVAGTKGQLVFADALYFVRPDVLRGRGDELLGAMGSAAVYGLYDRIVSYGRTATGPARRVADAALAPSMWGRLPSWRGRLTVGHLLKDLGDALLTQRDVWALAEQSLGNGPRRRRFPWR